ncbi:glutamate-5-semialdehyde dehydrogenase [bacterium endosymbiont of Bathymodiolus sp. 5 South]|jgi:glutamate-5-semialdehyde dehydrogenase|uniref:glutamate-5-semialdehyde dehydrogenase n=1 Tax=bacterium endosymbiont of Bathymodiolus sp. 5 South TaxID=1181670 RepID=UPI0010B06D09|nr:glutamate-5-semialdehyde dehydrogenase [bacterium endosymbiont of Bathymodiolus sp. 5 South]VVH60109.1 Gamma-glutamyl phosphate reductase (EC [uncultured Gammaproteobacteria bacterium]SHN92414.1 Gamma-glutamyl phosphate reductase [bacterium endosymbiont of Bathymodiolus sp. 5 South]SSC07726.1 Gamma-glutamyl phosphate reductase [bacterium endosymbiont of Bathymodiolus sp. 5 South]VVH61834.1 Gamma-glutamyl phosphate reductase (EC [uncultured Gammaproteobacteria bacterium]VVM23464.1 Gamma-glut
MDSIKDLITLLGQNARTAAKTLRSASTQQKNNALNNIATQVDKNRKDILNTNQKDLEQSKNNQLDAALLDRLMLNDARLDGIIESLSQIAALPDPVGEITDLKFRPSGIQVGKMRVPLGVMGIIYESRPNVTIDAAALCLKSGNGVILRGGSEAINSNLALYSCVKQGLIDADLDQNCVQLIDTTERSVVSELVQATAYIDAIIPRGGKGLVEAISDSAKVPVIKHLHGICHTYIDKDADTQKAIDIAFNGKTRRYGVCNATETLLVHAGAVGRIMPELIAKFTAKGVELRGCKETQKLSKQIVQATNEDWDTEYLEAILSIRIVNSMSEAIAHIDQHSSGHTESIVTENYTSGRRFMSEVDSSSIMVNASTAFADGFEYGLGAEIGISTDKFHVRGPVGLEGLTSQKYIVLGDGHIRP